jgi:hypothetical protein
MEIQCPRCQAFNREGAAFCDQCGAVLAGLSTTQTPPAAPGRPNSLPEETQPRGPAPAPPFQPPARRPTIETMPTAPAAPAGRAGPGGVAWEPAPGGTPDQKQSPAVPPAGIHAARPQWTASGNRVIGEAREVRQRAESEGAINWSITSFRVERYDKAGNRLQPVPVEMRATKFNGTLSEGDWVEIPGSWQPGQVMKPRQVNDLTTGAQVSGSVPFFIRISNWSGCIALIIILLAIVTLAYAGGLFR